MPSCSAWQQLEPAKPAVSIKVSYNTLQQCSGDVTLSRSINRKLCAITASIRPICFYSVEQGSCDGDSGVPAETEDKAATTKTPALEHFIEQLCLSSVLIHRATRVRNIPTSS